MGKMGYRASLQWIIDNDDTCWLEDEEPVASVTSCLVADIFDVSIEKLIKDLKRRKS